MAISILFNMINVGGQNRNGAVAVGEVLQSGWSAHAKQNIGQGTFFGISNTLLLNSYILDNDLVDAPINDNDITGSAQGQSV